MKTLFELFQENPKASYINKEGQYIVKYNKLTNTFESAYLPDFYINIGVGNAICTMPIWEFHTEERTGMLLELCPFCGTDVQLQHESVFCGDGTPHHLVSIEAYHDHRCILYSVRSVFTSEEDATMAWNTRAGETK